MTYPTLFLPLVFIFITAFTFIRGVLSLRPEKGSTKWIETVDRPEFSLEGKSYRLSKTDIPAILIITAAYAVVAFTGLGDTKAPQSFWEAGEQTRSVTIDLGDEREISGIMYYTGLHTGAWAAEISSDGVHWELLVPPEDAEYVMEQKYSEMFKWQYAQMNLVAEDGLFKSRYIRLTADSSPLCLGELAVLGADGAVQGDFASVEPAEAGALFDEQALVPERPNQLNGAYFDEIYHARTAYEHYTNVYPYEITHPPLGKLLIMLGIELFGMTPFGWRFTGTLFGVLMLPFFYALLKSLLGKSAVAACGTLIFAFDFMHFVQTRIATIDTYPVFFIILSYLFMLYYITKPVDCRFRETAGPLFFSGLFFGLGCASKWTGIYAGIGLLALYVTALALRMRNTREAGVFGGFLVKTLLFSVLSFIIVPAIIYCLSYIPYGLASGMSLEGGMLLDPDYYQIILDNQLYMWNYHSGIEATHPYSSTWWMWLADARPILYWLDYSGGYKSAFGAFNNPLVSWMGLLCMVFCVVRFVQTRKLPLLFAPVGYASQLLPWVFVPRLTFAYHYFPSTVFLVIAICAFFSELIDCRGRKFEWSLKKFTLLCVLLFVFFYPVLSGLFVRTEASALLWKWFPSWPFG